MKITNLLITALIFLTNLLYAQLPYSCHTYLYDEGKILREHPLDMKHLKLEVQFEPSKGLVKGNVTHYFTPLQQKVDSFFLDAPDILFKEVSLNGDSVKYKTTKEGVYIFPNRSLTWGDYDSLNIIYEAYPRKGLYFVGWNDPNNKSRKQIWSQGQGVDNRYWIPCYDYTNDKLTTEVIVTMDAKYKVLSNGIKLNTTVLPNGQKSWHYKMNKPHTTYLIMLGIGEYEIKESKSSSGVPISLWYYPDWENRFEATYKLSENMIDFFEKEIGVPYPWETYAQIPVQDFMYGAMENTTATLFGDFFCVDDRTFSDKNYVAVNAHELAHQWFGDCVTARTHADIWLQEGFATHYNSLFEREAFGENHFEWIRKTSIEAALNASKSDKISLAHSKAGGSRWYQKGAFVLDMLRYVVGPEQFKHAISYYIRKHGYKNVDSEDLLIAFHEDLGMSLDWFWEEWIYKGGEPHYKVEYQFITDDKKQAYTEFNVQQIHQVSDLTGLFKMPFVFDVYYMDGTKDTKTEWIEKGQHIVKIPNPQSKKVDFVLFDPNMHVIKNVTFDKPFEMLANQALKAEFMLDRYDAVVALRSTELIKKRDLLIQIFEKETFHGIKSEIVFQLIEDTDKKGIELIRMALKDKDVAVRKAIISQTKMINPDLQKEYEKLLTDASYETIGFALEKLCVQFPQNQAKYIELTKNVDGIRGNNIRVKRLELTALSNEKAMNELIFLASNSYEFLTRINAMNALVKLNYLDQQLLNYLIDGAFSTNIKLSTTALATLKHFNNQPRYKKMIADTINKSNYTNQQVEILATLK